MLPTLLCGLLMAGGYAQTPAAPTFAVASIKRCQNSEPAAGGANSPGSLHLQCVTTANLIRMAYLVFPTGRPNAPVSPAVFQQSIAGGPGWLDSDRYRIDARSERPHNLEMLRGPMLQALLEDRFHLRLHHENKFTDVFALTTAKSGARLTPATPGACQEFDRNHPPPVPAPGQPDPILCGVLRLNPTRGFDIPGATLAALCRQLTAYVEHEIVDQTGIAGTFDVHLDLTPGDLSYAGATPDPTSPFTPGDGRAIAAALEKLGLQMRPARQPAPFLVIDRIERPTEN
jgi:uncharacterized protein (TIGR03435 family)